MNVIEKYHERIMEMYLQAHPNADPNKVRQLCETLTEKRLKDIPCVMHNNMTHELVESTMINTFEWIDQRSPIITGNGTFFKQHSEYLAPTVMFLEYEQKDSQRRLLV
jgi:phosphohistidine phosphatase SixA